MMTREEAMLLKTTMHDEEWAGLACRLSDIVSDEEAEGVSVAHRLLSAMMLVDASIGEITSGPVGTWGDQASRYYMGSRFML